MCLLREDISSSDLRKWKRNHTEIIKLIGKKIIPVLFMVVTRKSFEGVK